MKKRLLTGSIILLVTAMFVLSRIFTAYAMDLFVGVLAIMGCIEVTRVLERKKMYTNIIFVGSFPAILYLAMYLGIIKERNWSYFLLYFIVILLVLFVVNFLYTLIFRKNTAKEKEKYQIEDMPNAKYGLIKCMNSTCVMIYPALFFVSMFFINHYFEFAFVEEFTRSSTTLIIMFFLTFTFAVTMITDSMALVVGRTLKGPKLCPLISPNKTISGAVGGFVFGALGGLLTYYLFSLNNVFSTAISHFGFTWWKILIVAGITSIIGQIGDIVASALKRSARVKDYGTIFPGHGGVMDRVDGLIFNSVAVLISMFILM